MTPRQLCNNLLHNYVVRPSISKGPHVLEVAGRKTLHVREGRTQVIGQPVNHLGAPALCLLPFQNVPTNLPSLVNRHAARCPQPQGL